MELLKVFATELNRLGAPRMQPCPARLQPHAVPKQNLVRDVLLPCLTAELYGACKHGYSAQSYAQAGCSYMCSYLHLKHQSSTSAMSLVIHAFATTNRVRSALHNLKHFYLCRLLH